jgi:hypothetical protein
MGSWKGQSEKNFKASLGPALEPRVTVAGSFALNKRKAERKTGMLRIVAADTTSIGVVDLEDK